MSNAYFAGGQQSSERRRAGLGERTYAWVGRLYRYWNSTGPQAPPR